jgi:hypothetical protein
MYSQSSPDTQTPRDDTFSQECVKPDVWGKLYATKEKFPYLGNALQLWYILLFLLSVLYLFIMWYVCLKASRPYAGFTQRHDAVTLCLMLC